MRATWQKRDNSVFSNDPVFMDPLNDKYPLKLTSEDEGRFVLLPLAAYPSLVEDKRDGHEHVGWALVITKVDKKQAWLEEEGQSPTGIPLHQMGDMVLLSV